MKHSKRCLLQKIESRTTAKHMRLGKMLKRKMGKRKDMHWLTSVSTILGKLEMLQPDKSPEPHEIHPMLLKQCAAEIARPLTDIYQRSFNDDVIPKEWKLENISPIFKKGKKSDAGNYRPVSLTSVPYKVMETIIKASLSTFLDAKSEMSKLQHEFSKGRSCLTKSTGIIRCLD